MNSLKVLGAAAALALILPMAAPTASLAQGKGGGPPMGGGHISMGGGGGGAFHGGGGGAFHPGGGAPHFGGGGAPMMHSAGPGPSFRSGPAFTGAPPRNFAAASTNWQHGGGNWHGGWRHRHHHGGFWPGFALGAGLGSYAYYGGGYYDPYYYNDDYYDEGPTVAVVPDTGDDAVAYCMQRFKSYDPASGTYLGYDGQRHPCP